MNMFYAIFVACLVASAAAQSCYKDVREGCSATKPAMSTLLENCNANYGPIKRVEPFLQAFANSYFTRSFEYLLMSTHFANYEMNRAGFEKLFRELSDDKWEEGIDIIKYLTKRGAQMNFNQRLNDQINPPNQSYELYEIESLAKALDMEKEMALQAFHIHDQAARMREQDHDPETSSWIEKEFVHKSADTIRKLSGLTSDLNKLLRGPDSSLSLFLFDEYLQKL